MSAHEVARAIGNLGFPRVTESTLRQWRRRGHIGRGPGYDPDEIADYLRRRLTRTPRVRLDNGDQ